MKILLSILLIALSLSNLAQKGITFEVEKLSKPQKVLHEQSYENIYKELILKDVDLSIWEIDNGKINIEFNILAKSKAPDSLVSFGYNSFFNGMYQAYADHRPFVLSPDMIWLLISQGFARHVNANSEALRKDFVDFSGKTSLVVYSKKDLLKDSVNWEEIFTQFTAKIGEHTGQELINTLTCDFSTTTPIEKVASEITIMESMEPYFEFVVIYAVCGIPEITLLGTPEDWQKVLDKTRKLEKYDLGWWTNELEPILEEFVDASQGDIKRNFWRNMFKYHSQKKYGAPEIIDGWIVRFFPYDKDGKRNDLKKLYGGNSLPEEMVKVDVEYIKTDNVHDEETMLELWAGFIGLQQDPETYALTPQISWMIKKKDIEQNGLHQKLESLNNPRCSIELKITEVPDNLKELNEIYSLKLHFKNNIVIPEWLKEKRIGRLVLKGNISKEETDKLIEWFPNTYLNINDTVYNSGNGWIKILASEIADVLEMKEIWILEIWNFEFGDKQLIIPDELKNVKIEVLSVISEISSEKIEKLRNLLPETSIFVNGKRI